MPTAEGSVRAREGVAINPDLLRILHDEAVHMATSPSPLLANWGRHLLEDWRSLELLADKLT